MKEHMLFALPSWHSTIRDTSMMLCSGAFHELRYCCLSSHILPFSVKQNFVQYLNFMLFKCRISLTLVTSISYEYNCEFIIFTILAQLRYAIVTRASPQTKRSCINLSSIVLHMRFTRKSGWLADSVRVGTMSQSLTPFITV